MIVRGLALISFLCLTCPTAYAAEYKLFSSRDFNKVDQPICHAYLKNLKNFIASPSFKYEWPIAPTATEFSRPEWGDIKNPSEHMDLIEKFYENLAIPRGMTSQQMWESQKSRVESWIHKGLIKLQYAHVDIKTGPVTIYRYGHPAYVLGHYDDQDIQPMGWWHYIPAEEGQGREYTERYESYNDSLIYEGQLYLIGRDYNDSHYTEWKLPKSYLSNNFAITQISTAGPGAYSNAPICLYASKEK